MMLKFKFIMLLITVSILSSGIKAFAEEKTKEYNESWSAADVASLEITNKFGEVKITNEGGSDVTIDVVITVEARDEKRADDLLDQIEVVFAKSGKNLKATTTIEKSFKGRQQFSIDYLVNIPADKDLKITNKFGNTIISSLTGNGDFISEYGNFTAIGLSGENTRLELSYGNANIGEAANIDIDVKYSGMDLGEVKNLELESKYSAVDIEEGKTIRIISKYDKFKFEEVESVYATTKYSHLNIEELAKNLEIESGYGGIRIKEIKEGFESVSVTNSYGKISLGMDDRVYTVDAECTYCGISYPEEKFSGDRMKEDNTRKIVGNIGSGTGGKVYLRSRYGEIDLTK